MTDPAEGPFDVAIVGGGIVGLATALKLVERAPARKVVVLEKEPEVGAHQTGHNSGEIHSGIYYMPGSAKAATCVEGRRLLVEFCQRHGIPHDICGKLIVATGESQLPRLRELLEYGKTNGVEGVVEIGPEEIREWEPHATGIRALRVPVTGIVDYRVVARKYAELVVAAGGSVRTGAKVTGFSPAGDRETQIATSAGDVRARCVVNCGGLHSDRIASLEGARPEARIVPFRGEFHKLVPARSHLVKGIIYPVPDRRLPFLGTHLTRRIDGGIEAGPNVVLALKREGYAKTAFSPRDAWEILTYPAFWRLARRHFARGLTEFHRSFSKRAFVRDLQRLVPGIREEDLQAGGTGVRAQALLPNGFLEDDFHILRRGRAIHVLNAPSPAATASLSIGGQIADLVARL
jgi:L-2-hydroxyglutarate oxidase